MSKHFFLYSIVGLILAGFVFSQTKASGPKQKSAQYAEPVKSPDGVLSVGAVRLWRDYEENEVAADTRYKGQRLSVTGTVVRTTTAQPGSPASAAASGSTAEKLENTVRRLSPIRTRQSPR